jgi:hypothetical protein
MKTPFLLLALAVGLCGQTAPTTSQLKAGEAPAPTGKIYIMDSTGQLRFATVGQGIVITCDAAGCMIDTPAIAPVALKVYTVAVSTEKLLTYTLPSAPVIGELAIVRNGLELTEGVDYSVAGLVVTFLAGAEPLQGDLVRVKYR